MLDVKIGCASNYGQSWTEVSFTDILIVIGLLQLTITRYKIRHAGGQAHYYSPTGTLKQRQVKLDWFRSLCFNVPVGE